MRASWNLIAALRYFAVNVPCHGKAIVESTFCCSLSSTAMVGHRRALCFACVIVNMLFCV